jgi:hypothetical protein
MSAAVDKSLSASHTKNLTPPTAVRDVLAGTNPKGSENDAVTPHQ